jgi:drug/metabolite transporter (DMT)-like permease
VRNSNGFLIAAAGFMLLTCGDALIKTMAGQWPAPAIAALRFTFAIPLLALVVVAKDGTSAFHIQKWWLQILRGFALAASSALFFLSIFLMPLAEATAIVFVNPVITAIISAMLLKEPMHPKAWLASVLALTGVLLVLRPNVAELGFVALLPLVAACFFSMMMICNRLAAGSGSPMALQWVLVSVAAPMMIVGAMAGHISGVPMLAIDWPAGSVIVRCAIIAASASVAHWLIFQGTMRATAADAAQAVYVQLPVALLIDALVFRHFPDAMALGGAALIICAGLSMWQMQRTRRI